MSIFEGLIKPTIDTTVNTDIDMSDKTQNTYNTYNITIDKLVIADERLALQLISMLGGTAAPKPERLPDHAPTPS